MPHFLMNIEYTGYTHDYTLMVRNETTHRSCNHFANIVRMIFPAVKEFYYPKYDYKFSLDIISEVWDPCCPSLDHLKKIIKTSNLQINIIR